MAFHAVAAITGEFDVTVGGVGLQVFSSMDLMYQSLEMDGPVVAGGVGIMAKLAILNIQALAAMLCQSSVATVAIFSGDDGTARYQRAVSHCEREDLVVAGVAHVLDFRRCPRLQSNEPVAFDGDRIATLSISWDRLLEGICQDPVLAGRAQSALPPIRGE